MGGDMTAAVASTCADVSEARLGLLGGFALIVDGADVPVPYAVQRLLVFLALHRRSLDRVYVAGSLWSEMTEQRVRTRILRATLWRSRVPGGELVRGSATHIGLSPLIGVDYHEAIGQARALLQDEHTVATSNEPTVFGPTSCRAGRKSGWTSSANACVSYVCMHLRRAVIGSLPGETRRARSTSA